MPIWHYFLFFLPKFPNRIWIVMVYGNKREKIIETPNINFFFHFSGLILHCRLMKYADLKGTYVESYLDAMLGNAKECFQDAHCNYNQCKSVCNMKLKKCMDKQLNNNLQIVCDKVRANDLARYHSGQNEQRPILFHCPFLIFSYSKALHTGRDCWWQIAHRNHCTRFSTNALIRKITKITMLFGLSLRQTRPVKGSTMNWPACTKSR